MDNGRPAPGSSTTVANAIPFRSPPGGTARLDQPSGSTPVRLTRRGQIVRSTLIVVVVLLVALIAGLVAGGISGVI
jgi:hypothetical protein